MIEPKFIKDEDHERESLQYDFLLAKGIELIQKFSGQHWTDYNYHDPGITLLEQFCYAITDLAYRTNFPIEDILIANRDDFDLENKNMLYPPSRILSSAPLTANDFRKIIIDEVAKVNNAWVHPVFDNKYGFKGLYNILIECNEEADESSFDAIKSQIQNLVMQHRSIGTDFDEIKILAEDNITIKGQINLDSFVLGESILAQVYYGIEILLKPHTVYSDMEEMMEKGYDITDLFTGPQSKKGFYDASRFIEKTNEIFVSDIEDLILNIEGVISIENLEVYKNGIKIFEDLISFQNDRIPSLDRVIHNYNSASDRLTFYRNKNTYEIDTVILSQLYDSLALNSKSTYYKKVEDFKFETKARFGKEELEQYYSIQNELPSIYGLKNGELPIDSNVKRISQMKQLKAYLSIFEQIMADHLSQLANVRNVFSIDREIDKTFYRQLPIDIPNISSILQKEDLGDYINNLNRESESSEKFFLRRNQIISHMLSRFGEVFDVTILGKLKQAFSPELPEPEIQKALLNSKLQYAENMVAMGRDRIKGFNYTKKTWETQNISGLEKRLKILLDFEDHNIKSLVSPLLDSYQKVTPESNQWSIKTLHIDEGPSISMFALNTKQYQDGELNYYCPDANSFNSLFIFGHRKKNYRIVVNSDATTTPYCLLFNSPNHEYPVKIFQSESFEACEEKRNKCVERFRTINIACEGFFMIEHLLLRPLVHKNYQTYFFFDDGTDCLQGFESGDFDEHRNFRDDIYIIGTDPDNYSIQKAEEELQFEVVLFDILNKPVFKSPQLTNSKTQAKEEIKRLVTFFTSKRNENVDIEVFSKIKIDDSRSHEFPTDFQYSNKLSFFFPNWPFKIQNSEFITILKEHIETFIPAHLSYDIFFLDVEKMHLFEDTYFQWLSDKSKNNIEETDILSLQLIQLIKSYNPFF